MAACVQYPGVKFQWAPLLQGVEGNGKSFLAQVVKKAIGEKYSHFPNAADLSGNGLKFTGWMHEKLFICIEEFYANGKTEIQEALKDKITADRIEMQHKGGDQFMGDNWANFMLLSNYKDAVLKSKSDRRYAIFYSAQQDIEGILASGMGGQYFPNLWNWARAGGYAIIADFLNTYTIPDEFNPAGACHRAPKTASTLEAIGLSLGGVEQEILEAIEEGRPGFRGGWVSSVAVDTLLLEKRKRVALNKRRALLEGLGYIVKERMNNSSVIDGGKKPTLYVTTRGEMSIKLLNVPRGAQTAAAYENAQKTILNKVEG
jgi:hypothetical protein